MPRSITFKAMEFATADEAIQHTNASGRGVAVSLGGRRLIIDQTDADRLAAAGVEFAYLRDHRLPDGSHRIVTVPVNG